MSQDPRRWMGIWSLAWLLVGSFFYEHSDSPYLHTSEYWTPKMAGESRRPEVASVRWRFITISITLRSITWRQTRFRLERHFWYSFSTAILTQFEQRKGCDLVIFVVIWWFSGGIDTLKEAEAGGKRKLGGNQRREGLLVDTLIFESWNIGSD